MKFIICLLLVFSFNAAFAGPAPIRVGSETDYVATAVAGIGGILAPGMTTATGSVYDRGMRGLFGYSMRKIAPESLPTVMPLLQHNLLQALKNDQWKTTLTPEAPAETMHPRYFFATARQGDETLEFYVILFPTEDGAVKIAYEQRRSLPEPSQPPQPASPTGS